MKCQSNIFRRQAQVAVPGSKFYSTPLEKGTKCDTFYPENLGIILSIMAQMLVVSSKDHFYHAFALMLKIEIHSHLLFFLVLVLTVIFLRQKNVSLMRTRADE